MFRTTVPIAILFVLLWNSGFIGAEYGLEYAGVFTQLFWRYSALTLILLLYLILGNRFRWPGWSIVAPTFLVGTLAHAVWLSCCLLSIQYGVPAGIVALVVALQPLVTGALSGPVVGEHTPMHGWMGLLVGFGGIALTVSARVDVKDTASLFAYLIPLGAVAAMTAATLIQRKLEVNKGRFVLPLDLTLFYHSAASSLVLIGPAAILEGMLTDWQPGFIGVIMWLSFGVSLCGYALMFELIKRMDATRVASLFYLGPPVTMLMAWAVLGDTLQLMDLIGLVVVGIGVTVVQLQFQDKTMGKKHHD
jgi:drug/metabolite transporter (DMT)-like permease